MYNINFDGFSKDGYNKKYNFKKLIEADKGDYIICQKCEIIYKKCNNEGSIDKIELEQNYKKKLSIGFKYLKKIVDLYKTNNIGIFLVTQGSAMQECWHINIGITYMMNLTDL